MTNARFQLSAKELQDAFLLNRLEEPERFGVHALGIDQWLSDQVNALQPDFQAWSAYFARVYQSLMGINRIEEWEVDADALVGDSSSRILSENCLPIDPFALGDSGELLGPYEDSDPVTCRILRLMDRSRTIIYRGVGYLIDGGGTVDCVSDDDAPHEACSCEVLQAVFASWDELPAGSPKKDSSRALLVRWLTDVVLRMRAAAEADFQKSAFASEDGRRIFSTDFVFVHSEDDFSGVLYPVNVFYESKIFLPDNPYTNYKLYGEITFARFLSLCAGYATDDRLVPNLGVTRNCMRYKQPFCASFKEGRIFSVSSGYCPNPLPMGGTPMRPEA